ncbi:MAG: phosphomannomutase/phosphoglucomutase [Alphaproteobacteria bacterium]|nr:phosphomannomutase/phosphoglucomutase [Alphaproteobacteria bacterium]
MTDFSSHPAFEPAPYKLDPEILREYDIRGTVDKNFRPDDAFAVGCAFGTMIRRRGGTRACVGYDGRASSPALAEAMIAGLVATGLMVENIGLGPSPMLDFALKDRMADGGVMITGSHNPPSYNGFKLTYQSGPLYGDAIQDVGRIAAAGDFASGAGGVQTIDVRGAYVDRLLRDFDGRPDLKIAWDCGNGATGEIVRRLTARLPGTHILLFDEIDGTFPNHHPDPNVDANLADLIRTVREEGCDLGVAFDGDGDRIGAVDEQGTIIRCDTLIAVYAAEILDEYPGATIIGDVKCSQVMYDEIARLGGRPLMGKTGRSLIKAQMIAEKAPLAGEFSGHIFFADKWHGADDGIYCAIRLLNVVSDHDGPASSLTAHLPRTCHTPEVRFEVDESEKFGLIDKVVAAMKARESGDLSVGDVDGARVATPDGWWLLRASNTQNALTTRVEATTSEGLGRLKAMLMAEVKKLGYDVTFPDH